MEYKIHFRSNNIKKAELWDKNLTFEDMLSFHSFQEIIAFAN